MKIKESSQQHNTTQYNKIYLESGCTTTKNTSLSWLFTDIYNIESYVHKHLGTICVWTYAHAHVHTHAHISKLTHTHTKHENPFAPRRNNTRPGSHKRHEDRRHKTRYQNNIRNIFNKYDL